MLSPKCLDLIDNDATSWEHEPLTKLVQMDQLMAYEHHGFWHPMDTAGDKIALDKLWATGHAPWKIW